MILDSEFSDFTEKIRLSKTQQDRINSAVSAISSYVKNYYDINEQDVFLQGSVATETVTKPQDNTIEYDVDIVAIVGDENSSPSGLLDEMRECFQASGTYKDKINDDAERPCIRLQYADESAAKFHVDIVPARVGTDAPLEIPTRKRNWRDTAPREFVQWSLDHTDDYRKAVMVFKRWRDNQEIPVSSIIIQVLVAEAVEGKTYASFTEMVVDCLNAIHQKFENSGSSPSVINPVLESEDLADKWDTDDFNTFKAKLSEAVESVNAALEEDDKEAAVALWQKVLGADFVATTESTNALVLSSSQIAVTLGDTSHAEIAPWAKPSSTYYAVISGSATWSMEKKIFKPRARQNHWQTIKMVAKTKLVSGQNLNKGLKLDYFLNTNVPKPYTIYWQVVNTGDHAKHNLRGEIQERTGHHINEATQYTGTHWVEAYVVRDNVCLAQSERFYININ